MPFQKIEQERIADTVIDQIEGLILRGILRPGERLPSERDLSERLGVSRPSLREAISNLQEKGLLESRASAGIFVGDIFGSAFSEPLIELFSTHQDALFDYIAFRRDLESIAAERAATMGTHTDIMVIEAIFEKMLALDGTNSAAQDAALDAEFHMAIIEASHNIFMLHMMRSMFEVLKRGIYYNREIMFERRATRSTILGQHRAILSAIKAHDPKAARQAVVDHLSFVETCMVETRRAEENETTAKLRYQNEIAK
ncbi:GntR family transcriptional regulator [Amylibacter marinus]|uniref:Pyruvate dehydrogenase complex repressor n=1 Tax=Amylibacter marinus TaxID=1475483 RepID=A0ABQ5VUX3_9RHOB|nr:FCD domain-containing protein [Amylibacter marinus]GLQ35240.1 GntR family transcriptional regulator [Amylibacter marinus]